MAQKIRVMIVDDSMLIRQVLVRELSRDPALEIVAAASNPIEAKPLILKHKPDVLTLDVEMPKMDGLTFLTILQQFYPVPVVMLSTLTAEGSSVALDALNRGAVEIMQKPGGGSFLALSRVMEELIFKIKAAAVTKRGPFDQSPAVTPLAPIALEDSQELIVAIGASTGGTQVLRYLMAQLPANLPPVVIVQHMPEIFTGPFAATLNQLSPLTVLECTGRMDLRPGMAVLARGGKHMTVVKRTGGYSAMLEPGGPVCHQCPSVEVLFHSVVKAAGPRGIGVILTGMGADGARGLLAMRQAGAATIAQNEETCAVFGMPREAIALGAAQQILPMDRIPHAIVEAVRAKSTAVRQLVTT